LADTPLLAFEKWPAQPSTPMRVAEVGRVQRNEG